MSWPRVALRPCSSNLPWLRSRRFCDQTLPLLGFRHVGADSVHDQSLDSDTPDTLRPSIHSNPEARQSTANPSEWYSHADLIEPRKLALCPGVLDRQRRTCQCYDHVRQRATEADAGSVQHQVYFIRVSTQ